MFFVVKPRYPQPNHGFAALTVVFVVKLVIQMVINLPKTWLLHFYYNKTMVNFHKDHDV